MEPNDAWVVDRAYERYCETPEQQDERLNEELSRQDRFYDWERDN